MEMKEVKRQELLDHLDEEMKKVRQKILEVLLDPFYFNQDKFYSLLELRGKYRSLEELYYRYLEYQDTDDVPF